MNLPNQLTLLRIILTPVFVSLLFMDTMAFKIAALVVFVIASLTDWYDGYFARKLGVTLWGQFLDPLADKILVSSALICFSVLGYIQEWMVLIIVIRDLMITGLRSYSLIHNQAMHTNFLAKAKTSGQIVVVYIIFLYYLFTWHLDASANRIIAWVEEVHMIPALMYMITAVTLFSGIIYMIENRAVIRKICVNLFRIFVPTDG
ncbi:CDP-diacylglycerol--glycerol-3-phosphate 3-phosphatidyltransferase [bacterium]|nr:CDP-diacylglycerol--glycerol-3-phosphate 3-phosphatidyltransferase [bacterium]